MESVFTRIIKGEIPSYKVAEDDRFFAFLDISPLVPGHTLVVPKREVDYIFDMDENELADMMIFARRVALAIEKVVPCIRIGVAVLGLEVPHAHIHLVPLNSEADISFSKERVRLLPSEFSSLAEKISAAL